MKADLREIYGASTRAAAEAAIDVFAPHGLRARDRVGRQSSGGFRCACQSFRFS
jgi:hypothetical protein